MGGITFGEKGEWDISFKFYRVTQWPKASFHADWWRGIRSWWNLGRLGGSFYFRYWLPSDSPGA